MNILSHDKKSKFYEVYLNAQVEYLLLKKFFSEFKINFENLNENFSKAINENKDLLTGEPFSKVDDITKFLDLRDESNYVKNLFPNFILSNTLLSVYSIFERNVLRLVELIEERETDKKEQFNLKNAFLDETKRYFKSTISYNISKNNDRWEKITHLSTFRNFIVHYYNNLNLFKKFNQSNKVKKLLDLNGKYMGFTFNEEKLIINDEQSILFFLEQCESLIKDIS